MMETSDAAVAWDASYRSGRYVGDPPVPFVHDIVVAAKDGQITHGLYVGCGNGRNYVPLVSAGLDLVGLDISPVSIEQLAERVPERRERLIVGDLSALPAGASYPLVVAIQVLQHGSRDSVHRFLGDLLERVEVGGLVAIRVNAIGTDIYHDHDVVERGDDGSLSVQYTAGPKSGLIVHFWAEDELRSRLEQAGFQPVMPIRAHSTRRTPPQSGQWTQWETIWRRRR